MRPQVMDIRKERREAALALRKAQMEAFDVDSSDPSPRGREF